MARWVGLVKQGTMTREELRAKAEALDRGEDLGEDEIKEVEPTEVPGVATRDKGKKAMATKKPRIEVSKKRDRSDSVDVVETRVSVFAGFIVSDPHLFRSANYA